MDPCDQTDTALPDLTSWGECSPSHPRRRASSELIALKVCQEAFKRDPTIKLKEVSLSLLKKGNEGGSEAAGGGQQAQLTPLISLQALMGEAADQITDPTEFGALQDLCQWQGNGGQS